MQKETIKFQESTVFEGMTSIRAIIAGIDEKINDRQIETVYYDPEKAQKNIKELGYLRAVSSKYGFILKEESAEKLDEMTLGNSHGGLVAVCGERKLPLLSESLDKIKKDGFYCMIQGIEDPYNFGYSLRSLYAAGCDGILVSERNWFSAAGVVARSSAGASERFSVFRTDAEEGALLMKNIGFHLVMADERTDNILGETELPFPLLLIVGGEKRGISRSLLNSADLLLKIPYGREFRASLSAASATTMFAYEILRQKRLLSKKAE